MTLDVMERPAPTVTRLLPRSAVATANVELARRTVAELAQPPQGLEEAGSRVLAKLRQFVGRDLEG
jgi:hypothetical protein